MERVVIHRTVDQCWFCKFWFYAEVLKVIEVAEKSFGSETVQKPICNGCLSQIEQRSAMA
jgi:hypothetical protein